MHASNAQARARSGCCAPSVVSRPFYEGKCACLRARPQCADAGLSAGPSSINSGIPWVDGRSLGAQGAQGAPSTPWVPLLPLQPSGWGQPRGDRLDTAAISPPAPISTFRSLSSIGQSPRPPRPLPTPGLGAGAAAAPLTANNGNLASGSLRPPSGLALAPHGTAPGATLHDGGGAPGRWDRDDRAFVQLGPTMVTGAAAGPHSRPPPPRPFGAAVPTGSAGSGGNPSTSFFPTAAPPTPEDREVCYTKKAR